MTILKSGYEPVSTFQEVWDDNKRLRWENEGLRAREDDLLRTAISVTWGEALADGSLPPAETEDRIVARARQLIELSRNEQQTQKDPRPAEAERG